MEKKDFLDRAIDQITEKLKQFDTDSTMSYTGFVMWISKILKQIDFDEKSALILYRYLVYLGYVKENGDQVIINPSQLKQ